MATPTDVDDETTEAESLLFTRWPAASCEGWRTLLPRAEVDAETVSSSSFSSSLPSASSSSSLPAATTPTAAVADAGEELARLSSLLRLCLSDCCFKKSAHGKTKFSGSTSSSPDQVLKLSSKVPEYNTNATAHGNTPAIKLAATTPHTFSASRLNRSTMANTGMPLQRTMGGNANAENVVKGTDLGESMSTEVMSSSVVLKVAYSAEAEVHPRAMNAAVLNARAQSTGPPADAEGCFSLSHEGSVRTNV
mmetsp:Transcript_30710/g.51896  ORF Transcript_30710/g.51896 Transcript_30710/m.51896 type:complete len:250 (+) Transcript_30710:1-750(+)